MFVQWQKEKGICDNYHGVTLLDAVGKIFSRVLLNQLLGNICPAVIVEIQRSFKSARGATGMIFSARQVQKCIEQQVSLYQDFVHLTKDFDRVNKQLVWAIVEKYTTHQYL